MMDKNTEAFGGCMDSFDPEQLICRNFNLNFHKITSLFLYQGALYPYAFKNIKGMRFCLKTLITDL